MVMFEGLFEISVFVLIVGGPRQRRGGAIRELPLRECDFSAIVVILGFERFLLVWVFGFLSVFGVGETGF